jgi:DNA mismatch endonuclease (patch repair protein)
MRTLRTTPSYLGLQPASKRSSAAARGSSSKTNSRCELILRRELHRRGLRYRLHASGLPGRPDIVFPQRRVVVFCDGDFWHGRDLEAREARLAAGHNAPYWIAKIRRNVERDKQQTRSLEMEGWAVIRFWETDILRALNSCAEQVVATVAERSACRREVTKQASARSNRARVQRDRMI